MVLHVDFTFEKPCKKSQCLALTFEPHDFIKKILFQQQHIISEMVLTGLHLKKNRPNLIVTQQKIQLLAWSDKTILDTAAMLCNDFFYLFRCYSIGRFKI